MPSLFNLQDAWLLVKRKGHLRLSGRQFLHAYMAIFDDSLHRSTQWNSSRAQQMQAVHTNGPHRLPGKLMKVRMVMGIVAIHDALLGSLLDK